MIKEQGNILKALKEIISNPDYKNGIIFLIDMINAHIYIGYDIYILFLRFIKRIKDSFYGSNIALVTGVSAAEGIIQMLTIDLSDYNIKLRTYESR